MHTTTTDDTTELKTSIAYWGSAYSFSVAILYLWGYWSSFNVSILDYMSLSDVVKAAAYPIVSAFIFMVIGVILGETIFPDGFMPSGGGTNTRAGLFFRRCAPVLIATYTFIIVFLILHGPTEKWRILPILLAIPTSFALREAGILRSFIKSERARGAALFLFAALPPYAYGHGALRANDILTGKSYTYVASEVHGYTYGPHTKQEMRLRYVGKAGEQHFLYSPEARSILVLPTHEIKILELKIADGETTTIPQVLK